MSWPSVKLEEVATIERKGIDASEIASGTVYLGLEHIESGGRILGFQTVANGDLASTKFNFGPNHILYGKLRPYLAKIAMPDFAGVCSTDILPIDPGPRIDRKFLAYFLRQPSMVDFAASRSAGANLPRLSPKALADFEIPLPPLEEQKRIAAILDQADSLRRLRQRAIDRLNSLGQAIFYGMFPEEDHVKTTKLADFTDIQVGYPFKSSEYTESNESVRLCRGANVLPSRIDWNDTARWPLSKLGGLQEFHLKEGDTVIAMDRPWISSGFKVAQISAEDLPALLVQRVARIRPRQAVHKSYIFFRINSRNFEKFCSPTETTIPHISPNEVKNFPIPVPAASKCEQFDKAIDRLSVLKRTAMIGQQAVDRCFYSLQHRAFQGEL